MNAYADSCGPRGFVVDSDDLVRALKEKKRMMMMAARRHGGPGHGGPGGPGGWRGFGGEGFGPRSRAGRGDVRLAVLALLAEGPRHGYQMIQEITERSEGAWRPSPGSVYPVLASLQDEGLVDDEKVEGKRVFTLTAAGRAHVEERGEELAHVFDAHKPEDGSTDMRPLVAGVVEAAVQVAKTGTPEQAEAARAVLTEARRALYLILAGDR